MRYIVTGGAGLIGGAIVRELNRRGVEDILVSDHLGTSEKWKNLRDLRFVDYLEKDLFRKRILEKPSSFGKEMTVIHMGACSSTTEKDASYLADNNFNVTKELALFALASESRFLYASSAATYGGGENGYADDEEKMDLLRPLNMYGYSKLLFDLWAKKQGILNRITGVKFTNVFGPDERHKGPMMSMVVRAFDQIRSSGSVQLFRSDRPEYADGEQKRDFIYVKDAACMVLGLLEKKAKGIYNVGSGRAESWNSLVTGVFDTLNLPVSIRYVPMPAHLAGKYQYYTCADMTKFNAAGTGCGARPLHDAVADYVQNHLLKETL